MKELILLETNLTPKALAAITNSLKSNISITKCEFPIMVNLSSLLAAHNTRSLSIPRQHQYLTLTNSHDI